MDNLSLAGFKAHALSPSYRRRLGEATELLSGALDDACYVSFSAGKDSSVCAHLCQSLRPGIPILMVDPGCPTHWLEDERSAWLVYAAKHGWALKLFPWDKWAAVAGAHDEDAHRAAAHQSMFAELADWCAGHGLTTRIMGLRAEESRGRAFSVAVHGAVHDYVGGGRRVLPIAKWGWRDVWAYIVTNDLPWLSIYDHGGPQARNGLIGRSGMANGRLAFLREHYPDAYVLARQLIQEDTSA